MIPIDDPAPHLLIVDDNRFDQLILAQFLQTRRCRISLASNGEQGYALALVERPDLILLDIRMPHMDGYMVCRRLKANPLTAPIPVIFLTGADSSEERVLGLSVGAVDVVPKPFPGEELLLRIDIHLGLAGGGKRIGPEQLPIGTHEPHTDVLIVSALQLIRNDLAGPLVLENIAYQLGTYGKHLNKVFRDHSGKTVFDVIREERMARGLRLLACTTLEINDIAELTGFSSAANFATAFRRHAGQTPTAYRQLQRGHGKPM